MSDPRAYVRELRLGNTGPDVLAVKRALIAEGLGGLIVRDEHMGDEAIRSLERFQRAERINVDGIYGPQTHSRLAPWFDPYGESLLKQERLLLAGAYRNPLRDVAALTFLGYDQGTDWGCSTPSPIYAIGPAIVTYASQRSGWPGGGAISYELTAGAAKGETVYLAEHIEILVAVGRTVNAATAIAELLPGYPDCEHGWAQTGTDNPISQPVAHPARTSYFGANFGDLLRSLGETRCPYELGEQGTPLPAGWPTWLPAV